MPIQNYDPSQPSRNDIFHTHGYTESQGSSLGSTSAETFTERRALGRERRFVRQYRGMSHIHSSPKLIASTEAPTRSISPLSVPDRPAGKFQEPPTRGYNPHS